MLVVPFNASYFDYLRWCVVVFVGPCTLLLKMITITGSWYLTNICKMNSTVYRREIYIWYYSLVEIKES
jgi:hypothetical protein